MGILAHKTFIFLIISLDVYPEELMQVKRNFHLEGTYYKFFSQSCTKEHIHEQCILSVSIIDSILKTLP